VFDGDGWEDWCDDGEIYDCNENCVDASLVEDGICQDGLDGGVNFNCALLYFDGNCLNNFDNCSPDCPVGILDFGLVNVGFDNETEMVSGQLEILMDCQFSVSDFEIVISDILQDDTLPPIIDDFNITQTVGGTSVDSLFNINTVDGQIIGSGSDGFVPPGEQSLIIVDFETQANNICFSSSSIPKVVVLDDEEKHILLACVSKSTIINDCSPGGTKPSDPEPII
jgi:hypothetical protein